MRVLLIALAETLPFALTQALNPNLECCAIVVDEPDVAKKILENAPPLREKVFPFYELKECIENFHYDVALWIFDMTYDWQSTTEEFKRCGLPKNKLISLFNLNSIFNFQIEKAFRYYKNHFKEFKTFATGLSYAELGLLPELFPASHKLFNFARASQDLYYDYQVAKFVFSTASGGGGRKKSPIAYAFIGLAPYSFHFDLTKSFELNFQVPQFLIAFDDVHNLWLPKNKYKSLFNEKYLSFKMPVEESGLNRVSIVSQAIRYIDYKERLNSRKSIDNWKDKNYPETVQENVKILDDYLTLCERNNVTPIIFLTPFTEGYMKYFSRKKLDEFYCLVNEAMKNHPHAVFFDGWKLKGFSDKDFHDAAHLNIQGAAKFTAIFKNMIEELEKNFRA